MLKNRYISLLKNFLWGKVGKYGIFFVTLQPISKKQIKKVRDYSWEVKNRFFGKYEYIHW